MINKKFKALEEFEKIIGHKFNNRDLLLTALTHSSYSNERKAQLESYERLEFLGDSLLGFITANYLFQIFKDLSEGELTKRRAALVCEKSLCEFSKVLNVGEFLRLSNGEINSGGRERASILADVFESIIAAIYIDSNSIEKAEAFVLRFIKTASKNQNFKTSNDYKTSLQEIVQKNPEEKLEYVVTGESGPDHDKHFTVEVYLNSNVIGKGGGRSKKEAEQQAAREALKLMGY